MSARGASVAAHTTQRAACTVTARIEEEASQDASKLHAHACDMEVACGFFPLAKISVTLCFSLPVYAFFIRLKHSFQTLSNLYT